MYLYRNTNIFANICLQASAIRPISKRAQKEDLGNYSSISLFPECQGSSRSRSDWVHSCSMSRPARGSDPTSVNYKSLLDQPDLLLWQSGPGSWCGKGWLAWEILWPEGSGLWPSPCSSVLVRPHLESHVQFSTLVARKTLRHWSELREGQWSWWRV